MYRLDLGTSVKLFKKDGLNKNFLQDLREAKSENFQCVEVSIGAVGGYKLNMEQCILGVEDGLKAVQDVGLRINSIHMPFQRFIYITSYDEGVRAWAMDEFRKLITVCDKYNPSHYVFHSKTGSKDEPFSKLRRPVLVQSFREMVDMTKNNICMENMISSYPSTVGEMIEVLEQVENGKCCIDTNHFLQDETSEAIRLLEKWVKTIHISDNDGIYEKHWLPKEGVNNWIKIIGALESIGYDGAFLYEVNQDKYGYSYADIRRNYEKLFEEYNKFSL